MLLVALLGVPGLILLASYLLLVREFGTRNLLPVRIHESGKYTLLHTVFYYNHFLRELPIDTLFAGAILWTYSAAGLHFSAGLPDARIARTALGIVLLIVLLGSLRTVGWRATLADLFQFRELDHVTVWGSHWQMHFLSTLAILLILIAPGLLSPGAAQSYPALALLFGVFFALSLIFRTGPKAVRHPRWILHGAREVLTYGLMVAIPAFAPLLSRPATGQMRLSLPGIFVGALVVLILLHSLRVYRASDVNAQAQSDRGLVFLVSSHFFEHMLDYLYILLVLLAFHP